MKQRVLAICRKYAETVSNYINTLNVEYYEIELCRMSNILADLNTEFEIKVISIELLNGGLCKVDVQFYYDDIVVSIIIMQRNLQIFNDKFTYVKHLICEIPINLSGGNVKYFSAEYSIAHVASVVNNLNSVKYICYNKDRNKNIRFSQCGYKSFYINDLLLVNFDIKDYPKRENMHFTIKLSEKNINDKRVTIKYLMQNKDVYRGVLHPEKVYAMYKDDEYIRNHIFSDATIEKLTLKSCMITPALFEGSTALRKLTISRVSYENAQLANDFLNRNIIRIKSARNI